jgi:hypothetical protein
MAQGQLRLLIVKSWCGKRNKCLKIIKGKIWLGTLWAWESQVEARIRDRIT